MISDCCQTWHPNIQVLGALKTMDTTDAFRNGEKWREKRGKKTLSTFSKTVQDPAG